ncbi:caspase family protein [Pseudonocardia nigra]|uniref:caspase family protein n=1 Tax=Pseudonocardia nigra TaxID=1921578 RepID=UPI001C5DE511|nr:caspase family protein [Pseudonocardia nigra]
MTDYAVVVGVTRYPELAADGAAPDLQGPDNDAQDVYGWLVDPAGGGLDPADVKLIHTPGPGFDPLDPQPARGPVEGALSWVERQTRNTPGNRLYLYFSGHGFAPVLEEGALFTAEASQPVPFYVYAHGWLRAFRSIQCFREYVLWMDCCMNFQLSIPVSEPPIRRAAGTRVPGPAFVGVAAQTGSALEHRMADGKVHGVFTWTLLTGLRGGASDERGRITGESLRTFLFNAMPEFLPEEVKRGTAVDVRPFVRADDGIVFCRLPARPRHRVRLRMPADVAGEQLTLWTGGPHRRVVSEVLTGPVWTGSLVRGLYVAEVTGVGLRHGFQVSGAGDVEVAVTRQGSAVVEADGSELFVLDLEAENAGATIVVTDHRFERVLTETGRLRERDAPGVYKIRVSFGRDIATVSDEIVLLDRDLVGARPAAPQLSSPAPLRAGTATALDRGAAPSRAPAEPPGDVAAPAAGRARVAIQATHPQRPAPGNPPAGWELRDVDGERAADLVEDGSPDVTGADVVATWEGEVAPGGYFLRRHVPGGHVFEGVVVASAGWTTQIALRGAGGAGPGVDAAVFMHASDGRPGPAGQDAVVEAARMALGQGANPFGEGRGAELQDLLLHRYEDPIAKIIGCHLLIVAMDAAPVPDPATTALLDSALRDLHAMVGAGHPDVAALGLRAADPRLRTERPFTLPPVFRRSWQLITEASYDRPDLVPAQLWARVHASTSVGPFFVWAADDRTRAAHAQQLGRWVTENAGAPEPAAGTTRRGARPPAQGVGRRGPLPDALRDAARRLHVPAGAAAALWVGGADPPRRSPARG